jgi:anti-anti-sigma factor
MNIEEKELSSGAFLISLSGRLDILGTDQISLKLSGMTAAPRQAIIINMQDVTYVASIGIRTLILAIKSVHNRSAKMCFLDCNEEIHSTLCLAGLDQFVSFFEGQKKAESFVLT